MAMCQRHFQNLGPEGFHRIAYTQWGEDTAAKSLVCVHGLTRNSRDFDFFADALQDEYRVMCPDLIGRGDSDWMSTPSHYGLDVMSADLVSLLARFGGDAPHWVGTSLGGILGMTLASHPHSPIRKLVMVDIGPYIPLSGLLRIKGYIGKDQRFESLEQVEAFYREAGATMGPLTDAQWRHLARHGTRDDGGGRLRFHYDPDIAKGFGRIRTKIDLWPVWEGVRCPVLVVRGAESDLLSSKIVDEMKRRGPAPVDEIVVAKTGHAPLLMDAETIDGVRAWLMST